MSHTPSRSSPVPSGPDTHAEVHAAALAWCSLASDPRASHAALLAAQGAYRTAKRAAGLPDDWAPPRKRYSFWGGRGLTTSPARGDQ